VLVPVLVAEVDELIPEFLGLSSPLSESVEDEYTLPLPPPPVPEGVGFTSVELSRDCESEVPVPPGAIPLLVGIPVPPPRPAPDEDVGLLVPGNVLVVVGLPGGGV
jgi:hypothetical protein